MPVSAVTSGGIGVDGSLKAGESVPQPDDPAVRRVIEFDHPELDDLVRGVVKTRRLGVEQDADLGFLS